MRMWFCSSGLGPGPSVGMTPATSLNGLAGPNIRRKKKPEITNSVTRAHPTSGSSKRLRKCHVTAAM
jgi:hypothetical protein